jgi:hypothetical protein
MFPKFHTKINLSSAERTKKYFAFQFFDMEKTSFTLGHLKS